MRRVTVPLARMGARFTERADDGLPLTVRGGSLVELAYEMPVSSAQIKSALLLAGLAGGVDVALREPHGRSRDHTERLLRAFGYRVDETDGWIRFAPTGRLEAFEMQVPGDPSSAAFLLGAAVLAEAGELRIARVGVNPTRIGFLAVLARMGAPVMVVDATEHFGEPVADLVVRPTRLRATEVAAGEIPGLIDEIPLLAVLASRAGDDGVPGGRRAAGQGERPAGTHGGEPAGRGLLGRGVGRRSLRRGRGRPPRGRVRSAADHRVAMAFAVLGTVPGARVRVDDMACAAVSFPRFSETLRGLARRVRR